MIACSISSKEPWLRFWTTSVATSWETSSAFVWMTIGSFLVVSCIVWFDGLTGEGFGECDVSRDRFIGCTSRVGPRFLGC